MNVGGGSEGVGREGPPQLTHTTGFMTLTIPRDSIPPSSTVSTLSTASSDGSKPMGIASAVGIALGLFFGALFLFLVVHWTGRCRTWRYLNRTARIGEKAEKFRQARGNGGMQPMTDGQNSPIGTPYIRSSDQARGSTLNPPLSFPTESAVELYTGDTIQTTPAHERHTVNDSPPTYAESNISRSRDGRSSVVQLNTFNHNHSETAISPMTPEQERDMAFMSSQTDGAVMTSPQSTRSNSVSYMSRQLTGEPVNPLPRYTRYPVGSLRFHLPIDRVAQGTSPTPPPRAYTSAPRDSLEGMVRRALAPTDSPEPSERHPSERHPSFQCQSSLTKNISSERYPRRVAWTVSSRMSANESYLGARKQLVTLNAESPPPSDNAARQVSQRTVASDSTMGMEIVSNAELERLGVGSKTWHGR